MSKQRQALKKVRGRAALGPVCASLLFCAMLFCGPSQAQPENSRAFPKPDEDGTVEVALASPLHTLVLFLSGDGGWWGDLDAQLANYLAARGYAVVGVDTSIYFNDERARSEMSGHMQALLHTYGRRMNTRHVVLIGYSFGANMVPLIYNDLPHADKAMITDLVLLAPEQSATLEVTLSGRIGIGRGNIDLAPEFMNLPAAATACVYGLDEGDQSGCVLPGIHSSSRVALPGGHHFDRDPERLGKLTLSLIESAERRTQPAHHPR